MKKYIPLIGLETDDSALATWRGGIELERETRGSLRDIDYIGHLRSELNSPTSSQILQRYAEAFGLRVEDFRPVAMQ